MALAALFSFDKSRLFSSSFQIERIIFCLFLPVDVDIYEELFQTYFPVENDELERDEPEAEEKQGARAFLSF